MTAGAPPSDHDILVEISTLVKQVHTAVYGNGKPGLLADVVTLKEDMRKRELEATELRDSASSKRKDALVGSGVLTVALVSLLTAIKQVFGL